jgi:hypothetical protein
MLDMVIYNLDTIMSQRFDSMGYINCIPKHNCSSHQVQHTGSITLRLYRMVAKFALAIDEHSTF